MFCLLLPKATKHWNLPLATKQDVSPWTSKHWIHFKGHQKWNISRATEHGTFHWPPSWGLPSPTSFPFFLKGQIGIICLFLFGHDFRFEYLKSC